jgi:hypothetical protein
MAAIIAGIAVAVGSVFKFATSAKDKKAQQAEDRAALVKAAMDYKTAQLTAVNEDKPSYTWLYVILAAGVVGALIGFYFITKPKAEIKPQLVKA